jgi:hypothetical protein
VTDSEKVADSKLLTDSCAPFRSVVQTSGPWDNDLSALQTAYRG